MRDARLAASALMEKYSFQVNRIMEKEKYKKYDGLWYRAYRKKSGVTVYNRELASQGLTFYTDHTPSACLIDMEGKVLHKWHKPFSEVWPDPAHILSRVPDSQIYWRKSELLPDGAVLAIYEGVNQAPYGGGLIKLDRDSNLIWKLSVNAHHDLEVLRNGNILVLTQ